MKAFGTIISILLLIFSSSLFLIIDNGMDRKEAFSAEYPDGLMTHDGTRNATWFTNVTEEAGLSGVSGNFFSWGDYNNDGYEDLLAESRLFRNNGPPAWDFAETTQAAGLSGGGHGTWADYDNDGLLDLYMVGSNRLWRNNGPGAHFTFTDATSVSNVESYSHTTACAWGDYDDDGFLDLFIARGENWNDGDAIYYPNVLYRNNGDGTFTNVTLEAGVDETDHPSYSRGVVWGDYNNDGWQDIYVANYRQQLNYLYENNGDGTFTDVAAEKGVADGPPRSPENPDPYDRPGHGVGALWGDYDNDGYLDLWVTNLNHKDWRTSDDSLLYRNDGPPGYTFTNVRSSAGIPLKPYVAPNEGDELFVGCAWDDFNNDGYLDIYLPQVYDEVDYAYSFLYAGCGDGTFTDVTDEAGVRVWNTYASSWCDYDNDGMTDLLTAGKVPFENGTYEIRLFRNDLANENNWLRVHLVGTNHNSKGIGARVTVVAGDERYMKEVEGGMGAHGQQNSIPLDFGLGQYQGRVDLIITWGPGKIQNVTGVGINGEITVTEVLDTPDLAITGLSLSNEFPIVPEVVEISCRVKNRGGTQPESAVLAVYIDEVDDGNLISPRSDITDLTPLEERDFRIHLNTSGLAGDHTIKAYIEDVLPPEEILHNNFATIDIDIRERNELPWAELELSAREALTGEVVTMDAAGSTDDVMISEYMFDFGDGDGSGWTEQKVVNHKYGKAGEYEVVLFVLDSDGAVNENTAKETIVITDPPNKAPQAEIVSISPERAKQGKDTVEFKGKGTDTDGEVIAYSWRSSLDGKLPSVSEFCVDAKNMSTGEHTIFLKVMDDEGRWSGEVNGHLEIIEANAVPTAKIEEISPTPSDRGEEVYFRGRGEDADGEIAGYRWFSSVEGELSDKREFSTDGLFSGEHTISLIVIDNEGAESSPDTRVHVVRAANQPPTCYIVSIEPESPVEGEPVVLTASGEDLDGNIVEYRWWSGEDGNLGFGRVSLVEEGLSYGNHTIYVLAEDDDGAISREASITVTVTWSDIKLELTVENGPAEDGKEGVSLYASVRGRMYDDFRRPVRLEFKIDGGRWEIAEGSEIQWEDVDRTMRRWTLKLNVKDLEEGGHVLSIRGFDGISHSAKIVLSFQVDHGEPGYIKESEKGYYRPLIVLASLLLIFVLLALIVYIRRTVMDRKMMREEMAEDDFVEVTPMEPE